MHMNIEYMICKPPQPIQFLWKLSTYFQPAEQERTLMTQLLSKIAKQSLN